MVGKGGGPAGLTWAVTINDGSGAIDPWALLLESDWSSVDHCCPKGRKGWSSEREAGLDAFRWLHRYNTRRRHSRLGQRAPIT